MKVSKSTSNSNSGSISTPTTATLPNKKISKPLVTTNNISITDKAFVDFCRCLYQAKAVVRELESFSDSVCPALKRYHPELLQNEDIKGGISRYGNGLLLKQVDQYLNTTFRKFTRLCNILMVVLTQMEAKGAGQIKRERIDSFRFEVWEEWKTATSIKQRLIYFTQQCDIKEKNVYTSITTTTTTTTTTTLKDKSSSSTTTTSTSTTLPWLFTYYLVASFTLSIIYNTFPPIPLIFYYYYNYSRSLFCLLLLFSSFVILFSLSPLFILYFMWKILQYWNQITSQLITPALIHFHRSGFVFSTYYPVFIFFIYK